MPTYEYRCQSCGHELEQFQPITAEPLKECPKCETPGLKRLISGGAAIIFKGSGFYETDYRSENYKKAAKADKEAASGGEGGGGGEKKEASGGEKPAEAKPAATSDAKVEKPVKEAAKPSAAKSDSD